MMWLETDLNLDGQGVFARPFDGNLIGRDFPLQGFEYPRNCAGLTPRRCLNSVVMWAWELKPQT